MPACRGFHVSTYFPYYCENQSSIIITEADLLRTYERWYCTRKFVIKCNRNKLYIYIYMVNLFKIFHTFQDFVENNWIILINHTFVCMSKIWKICLRIIWKINKNVYEKDVAYISESKCSIRQNLNEYTFAKKRLVKQGSVFDSHTNWMRKEIGRNIHRIFHDR